MRTALRLVSRTRAAAVPIARMYGAISSCHITKTPALARPFRATSVQRVNPLMLLALRWGPMVVTRTLRRKWWNNLTPKQKQTILRRFGGEHPYHRGGVVLVALGAGFGAYLLTMMEHSPITARKRLMSVDPAEVRQMSSKEADRLIADYGTRDELLPDSHPTSRFVNKVAARVIQAVESSPEYMDSVNRNCIVWRVFTVKDDRFNAFVLPTGEIFVYTGLVQTLSAQPDGLACVIGHEMAHALCEHTAEKLSLGTVFMGFNTAVLSALFAFVPLDGWAGMYMLQRAEELLWSYLTDAPYSRKLETEADRVGLTLAARACYDPSSGPLVWQIVASGSDPDGPSIHERYMSTHPTHEQRIKALGEQVPQALDERLLSSLKCSHSLQSARMFTHYDNIIRRNRTAYQNKINAKSHEDVE